MKVVINNEEVDVIIVYKNNKNLYIRVKDNKFYVTCNKYYTIDKIKEIINNNITSLTKMYNKALKVNNNTNYYLGKEYIVVYDCNVKKLFIDNDMIFVKDKKMLLSLREQLVRLLMIHSTLVVIIKVYLVCTIVTMFGFTVLLPIQMAAI